MNTMNHYTYSFRVACPNNNEQIDYHLHIESTAMIQVEAIKEACAFAGPQYHEAVATVLQETLGGFHVLIARHHNVTIRTERGVRKGVV